MPNNIYDIIDMFLKYYVFYIQNNSKYSTILIGKSTLKPIICQANLHNGRNCFRMRVVDMMRVMIKRSINIHIDIIASDVVRTISIKFSNPYYLTW